MSSGSWVTGEESPGATLAPAPPRKGSVAPPGLGESAWAPPVAPPAPAKKRKYLGYEAGRSYLRRRLGALIVDNLVTLPLILPCALVLGGFTPGAWFLFLALYLTYFFLCELHSGQTLGKRAAGLRVVRADGRPVDAMSIGARNVLRFVDGIPGPPLVGALAMALTGARRRRVGDVAGGTMVVEAEHQPFVRAPRSPLVTVYPVLWLGAAVAGILMIGHGGEPYLANVDDICKQRVEIQTSAPGDFVSSYTLTRQETEAIEALPYPSRMSDERREILTLKYRVEAVWARIIRAVRASRTPEATYQQQRFELKQVVDETNRRFDEMGLHYCAK
jgi:uncharacterized RDD family membrane protein YckC